MVIVAGIALEWLSAQAADKRHNLFPSSPTHVPSFSNCFVYHTGNGARGVLKVLVGNKCDKERDVPVSS